MPLDRGTPPARWPQVQRPGLRALFDIDLDNLAAVARQLDAQDEARDFTGIYQVGALSLCECGGRREWVPRGGLGWLLFQMRG